MPLSIMESSMGWHQETRDGKIYDFDKDYEDTTAHRIIILYNLLYDLQSESSKLSTAYVLQMGLGWINELFLKENEEKQNGNQRKK